MTIAEFRKLKDIIDKALEELENKAIENQTIMSVNYEPAIIELKKAIIERAGFDFKDYEKLEKMDKSIKKSEFKTVLKKDIPSDAYKYLNEKEIYKIVEEIVKKNPPKIINKKSIVKETIKEKPTIIERIDNKSLDNVRKDIIHLQTQIIDFDDYLNRLNSQMGQMKDEIINEGAIMEKVENLKRWNQTDDKIELIRQSIARMTWGFDEQIKGLQSNKVPYLNASKEINLNAQNLVNVGNVGIGTATPAKTLDVAGDITLVAGSGNYYSNDGSRGKTITTSWVDVDTGDTHSVAVKNGIITSWDICA